MRRATVTLLALAMLLLGASEARAATVVNGDFETGDLSGWTISSSQGVGAWMPYSNFMGFTLPPQGTFAAMSWQTDVDRMTMYQDIALDPVNPGGSTTLSLYAYYAAQQSNSVPLQTPSPDTLDENIAGINKQYRVEVMRPTAPLDSVNPSDILATVFKTKTNDPFTVLPTDRITVDLTPFAGQTVRLRAVAVSNNGIVAGAIDDVRIDTDRGKPKIQFSKPQRNPKNGIALLPVEVSGAGTIVLSGDSVKTRTIDLDRAGTRILEVTPINPLKKKLKRKRSGQAFVTATFTDAATGDAATDTRRVHLRRKRK